MQTVEKEIHVKLDEVLVAGKGLRELQGEIKEALIIRGYLTAELSMGEAAELLGLRYEDARQWFHSKGIATLRKLAPEMQAVVEKNYQQLAQELGLAAGKSDHAL